LYVLFCDNTQRSTEAPQVLCAYLGQLSRLREALAKEVAVVIDDRDAEKLAAQEDDSETKVDANITQTVERVQVSRRVCACHRILAVRYPHPSAYRFVFAPSTTTKEKRARYVLCERRLWMLFILYIQVVILSLVRNSGQPRGGDVVQERVTIGFLQVGLPRGVFRVLSELTAYHSRRTARTVYAFIHGQDWY
jgi:hypothetical protein